jgi:aminopeptidase N
MGDDSFFQLLRTLVADYRYQILTPEILMQEAQKISGKNLEPLYREWILTAKKL